MNKGIVFLLTTILVVMLITCKKVDNVDPLWVDTWYTSSGGSVIKINSDSKASYIKYSTTTSATSSSTSGNGNGSVTINYTTSTINNNDGETHKGTARIKKDKLYIGTKSFKIDQHPKIDPATGRGTMILNGGVIYYSESTDPPPVSATCNDGIMNQNEIEVDCGGVCEPCYTNFYYNYSDVFGSGGTFNQSANTVEASSVSGQFTIKVDMESTAQNLVLIFKASSIGTYTFDSMTYLFPGGSAPGLARYYYISGNINITEYDSIAKKISATFSFIGYNSSATSIINPYCNVTSSSFTDLKFAIK